MGKEREVIEPSIRFLKQSYRNWELYFFWDTKGWGYLQARKIFDIFRHFSALLSSTFSTLLTYNKCVFLEFLPVFFLTLIIGQIGPKGGR